MKCILKNIALKMPFQSPIKETFLDKLKLLSVDKNYYKDTMKSCDITG